MSLWGTETGKKRTGTAKTTVPAVLLLAALVLSLTGGCAALYDEEYYVSAPYQAPAAAQEEEPEAAYDSIGSYAALRRALTQLVEDHVESAQLQFSGYEGDLSQDISTACWEVKSSTALGAFAMDYISYDLSRIVSYYQAEVNVAYKRSAGQVAALEQAGTLSQLADRLAQALKRGETYLVLEISAASATADTVREYVTRAYFEDPAACPVLPEVDVGLYPETGVSRIAEVSFNYGLERAELERRRQAVAKAVDEIVGDLPASGPGAGRPRALYALCQALGARCIVDSNAGSAAWNALAGGRADSQGMALAFCACAKAIGVDCQVVSGRMDSRPHCWVIVTIGGESCHIDPSRIALGEPTVFLAGDEQLWGLYWWDTSQYPVCPAALDFRPED